ncbi:MAG TPA: DUF4010 domain-containing protein [Candidatus Dormibacteraeota bacterium]|nr:DUF4010 domain-containing protein [Candidatus Dormibacteraeota bacterium]
MTAQHLALLLGLTLFFGFAFEEFYAAALPNRPGGIRTFPLLGLLGAALFEAAPASALAFTAGLALVGAWTFVYYRARIERTPAHEGLPGELIVPVCNALAYALGPVVLTQPAWVAVAIAVAAVMLLAGRERLHRMAAEVQRAEVLTLGKFLILVGIVLPLVPKEPVTTLTTVTPYQAWLAVVVVSSLSYFSYLAQRYLVSPRHGTLLAAALGGLYSSTATTVVLSRELRAQDAPTPDITAGIVVATTLMYLRILAVLSILNSTLARALTPVLLGLFALGVVLTALLYARNGRAHRGPRTSPPFANPLELNTAFIFAALFVFVSIATTWARARFGSGGIYALAAVVGVTDIDPFVLSLAEGSVHGLATSSMAVAVIVAASSNNLLKAAYAMIFGGVRRSAAAAAALLLLTGAGLLAGVWVFGGHP